MWMDRVNGRADPPHIGTSNRPRPHFLETVPAHAVDCRARRSRRGGAPRTSRRTGSVRADPCCVLSPVTACAGRQRVPRNRAPRISLFDLPQAHSEHRWPPLEQCEPTRRATGRSGARRRPPGHGKPRAGNASIAQHCATRALLRPRLARGGSRPKGRASCRNPGTAKTRTAFADLSRSRRLYRFSTAPRATPDADVAFTRPASLAALADAPSGDV
jgi:hypothetical protein